jgi:hypothetical protein
MAPFLIGCVIACASPTELYPTEAAVAEKPGGEELILLDILVNQLKSSDPRIRQSAIFSTFTVFQTVHSNCDQVIKACEMLVKIQENKKETIECRSSAMNTLCHAECYNEKSAESFMRIILDKSDGIQARAMVFAGLQTTTRTSNADSILSQLCQVYCDSGEDLAVRLCCVNAISSFSTTATATDQNDFNALKAVSANEKEPKEIRECAALLILILKQLPLRQKN